MKFKNIKDSSVIRKAMPYCIAILFYVVITHLNLFGAAIGSMLGFISPVFFGLVLAYIMDPMVRKLEAYRRKKGKKHPRGVAITVVVLAIVLSLLLLMAAVVPQFMSSLVNFTENTTSYHSVLQSSVDKIAGKKVDLTNTFVFTDRIMNSIRDYVTTAVKRHSKAVGNGLMTFAISYILAIYFLIYKEKLQSGAARLMKLLIKDKVYKDITVYWHRCDAIFIKYLACEVIDALIVGAANAVFMVVFQMPYVPLVSVVVGVTNLIPNFGPIIGAAVGGFILLIVNPLQAVLFLIFTGILQTLDGYVIKPKLFGDSLGVSGIWILITVVVGGRIFGVWGMLLAIPFAAIFDIVYHEAIIPALERRKKRKAEEEKNAGYETEHAES